MSAELRVLHEDERLLAADKPAGALVIPGRGAGEGEPLVEAVERRLGGKAWVVHRIDRETSGIVVFAKDAAAHKELCRAFEEKSVRKLYLAAVRGTPASPLKIVKPLRRFGSGRVAVSPDGKYADTRARVRERLRGAALLEVEPRTGRQHQIRAHLYAAGHPVLGDPLYGDERSRAAAPRLMLHSHRVELPRPEGGALKIESPLPPDFEAELARLKR